MVKRALAIVLAVAACQGGGGGEPTRTGSGSSAPRDAGAGFGSQADLDDASPIAPDDAAAKAEEPEAPDPGKLIAELGAIPAWQAVVERAQLLARRSQHGIAYGRLGPPILVPGPPPAWPDAAPPGGRAGKPIDAGMIASPYVWLIDDTDGNGALAIRVVLGKHAAKEGDRVAIGGAWQLDEDRRWYWKADSVTPLPPAPPSDVKDPPAAFPTHEVQEGRPPPGARPIALAKDHDAVIFQVVGQPPGRDGDGWLVANQLGDVPFARMIMPGERASYGGQEMRTDEERWHLKRGKYYWVRIGRIRKYAPDQPATIYARTAPVLVN